MILADTGFFIALGNNGDRYHSRAIQVISTLREPLITTYPVITETSYLLARDAGLSVQFEFLTEVANGMFPVFDFQRQHLSRMVELMRRYANLPMDLADASLVVLAEHLDHGRILTCDRRDFSIYRWNNNNLFENLLIEEV
ncbi:type II toxin-antitoxin system VapC family toxin [Pseudanabaena sp. UWO310]|uniref:type II toxin-antitoxin system VapC family toxin n=1 Tax=Pseudanabaena sp. UWO310 TaxID=2480795 RepID=UPI001158C0E9|nr:PIN domain-containing protein [Pseudanabaena sp. UWO310]TYQ30200.1 PIN domain-containing protein [Pseudanabaena sp. UWO310]